MIDPQRLWHAVWHPGDKPRYCLITSYTSGPELGAYLADKHAITQVDSVPMTEAEIQAGDNEAQAKNEARDAALRARGEDPRFGDGSLRVMEEEFSEV